MMNKVFALCFVLSLFWLSFNAMNYKELFFVGGIIGFIIIMASFKFKK
jgi:multisubunit Na+/H+ antiporter MnhE subunit